MIQAEKQTALGIEMERRDLILRNKIQIRLRQSIHPNSPKVVWTKIKDRIINEEILLSYKIGYYD